jgi:hypothetical protein
VQLDRLLRAKEIGLFNHLHITLGGRNQRWTGAKGEWDGITNTRNQQEGIRELACGYQNCNTSQLLIIHAKVRESLLRWENLYTLVLFFGSISFETMLIICRIHIGTRVLAW